MKQYKEAFHEMKTYLLFWATQAFSALGSSMTGYALVIWSYTQEGSALMTALLMVCSYAPYVIFSIFAGALSDRWNKKRTLLLCDTLAAVSTLITLILLLGNNLRIWHLYLINMAGGLMNTVQQPASEVVTTRLLPKKYYQRVGGLRYLSSSLNSILTPIIATAFFGLAGLKAVIAFDLFTFAAAFLTLALGIRIPEETMPSEEGTEQAECHIGQGGEEAGCHRDGESVRSQSPSPSSKEGLLTAAKAGIGYLKREKGIFGLILFLAAINLVASVYNAAFPAMLLSREGGSEKAMGLVNTVIGLSTLAGSLLASFARKPKSRVRVVCNCLLFSMSFENFLLALGRTPFVWCVGGFLGWICIPLMDSNLDAILRLYVPVSMQGRVYSVRNSLQFFTIPIGFLLGGALVDQVFEPLMAAQSPGSLLIRIFGSGKGSGAALLFFVLAFAGIGVCLYFRRDKNIWKLDEAREKEG